MKHEFVDKCVTNTLFNPDKVKEVVAAYQQRFEAKGLRVFFMSTSTTLVNGSNAGDRVAVPVNYFWLEFLDLSAAPDYVPDVPGPDLSGCSIL